MPKKLPRFVKQIAVNSVTGHANANILRRFIEKRQNRIFFYPAARFDFEVLRQFDGWCSTFIYCDHFARLQEFESRLPAIGLGWEVGKVQVVDLRILRLVPEQPPEYVQRFVPVSFRGLYETVTDDWRRNDAWGRCVILSRRHGRSHKRIKLYYFCAEEFTAYLTLFTNANAAPQFVCLKNTSGFDGYLDLNTWAAPLGRAVAESPQPEFIVVAADEHGKRTNSNDWPWLNPWNRFPSLQAAAFTRKRSIWQAR